MADGGNGLSHPAVRIGAIAACLLLAGFWVYAVTYLILNARPDGGGMELVAIVPMTFLLGVLTVPGLVTAWRGRHMKVAIILALASAAANVLLWRQLLSELA